MKDYTSMRHFLKTNIQTQQAALVNLNKAAFLNSKQALVSQLQVGDLLQGSLTQDELGKLLLQLKEGLTLQVHIKGEVLLHQEVSFVVEQMSQEGIILRLKEQPELSEKVRETLNLPKDQAMKLCIEQFMQDELPMDKEVLMKSYQLHKEMKIPFPVLTQLIEKNIPEAKVLLNIIKNSDKNIVSNVIDYYNEHIIGELPPVTKEEVNNVHKLLSHLLSRTAIEVKEEVLAKDVFKLLPEVVKEQLTKGEQPLPIQQLEKAFLNHEKEAFFITKELYKHLFKADAENIGKMLKSNVPLKEMIVLESYNELVKCINLTEEMTLPKSVREDIRQMYEPMIHQAKMNVEGQYFVYPFHIGEEKREAELYFYQPKKRQKKGEKDYLAVLKLDLAHLKTIEIHMHQIDQQVRVDFLVETETIDKLINKHLGELNHKLEQLPYDIIQCRCYLNKGINKVEEEILRATGLDLKV